jgi:hypothetical protein
MKVVQRLILTNEQWTIVEAVWRAAAPGGPIVSAMAATGAVGGCIVSNVMDGWKGGPASPAFAKT